MSLRTKVLFFWAVIGCFLAFLAVFAQEPEYTYDDSGKRNPFLPLVTSDGRLVKIEEEQGEGLGIALEGIIYDKSGLSYAIVNANVVKIGDKIGDYQVYRIDQNRVVFLKDSEPVEVYLEKEEP